MRARSTFLKCGLLAACGLLAGRPTAVAQSAPPADLWRTSPVVREAVTRSAWAQRLGTYRAVETDAGPLAATLATAPLEGTAKEGAVLTLPTPDGGTARFRIVESPVMEAELAARFPQIRTYAGVGLDDPTARLRCDLTPRGFHAQVLTGDPARDFKLDPVDDNQPARGLVSYWLRSERATPAARVPACREVEVPGRVTPPAPTPGSGSTAQRIQASVGTTLRTYRWAVAATGEYTASQGGTVSSALAAITTMANRVTGTFEYEMAVRLVLIAGETSIIYTNGATDPYTSGDKSAMLDQNRSNLNSVIGNGSFDLGHVLDNANLGGVAYIGSVCGTTYKGGGVSGLTPPAGTAFEGVVAHETGHQFSARHTFSGTVGGCTPSNPTTAWEPGSGSTIMSYAGSCGTDDVDGYHLAINNYFHGGSIEQMASYIASSGTCASSASTGNTVPTITAPAAKSIPANTPFRLTATGSDANGDALTYNWEEMDLGSGTLVTPTTTQTTNSTLPLFRSWPATTSPTRYFPRLSDLRANTTVKGEVLPKVARSLKFRCTARDQHYSSTLGRVVGGVNQSATLTLTVVNTGAAFAVTSPTTSGTSWNVGGTATVTWNVAGTTATPISCANVSILLSTDGGATYPTTLAASTANDGSEVITVPGIATSQARVMVAAVGNYFFDISDQNFSLVPAPGAATTVTGFSPANGPAGTVVTITGTNFTGATSVQFNGTAASSYTVNSATQITATVPALASTGPIAVTTTPGGTGTSAGSFTVELTNDLCSATLPTLYCGVPIQGTTKGATATGDPTGTCGTTINAGGVFYRYTGTGGPVTIATCGGITGFDTKLFVFTGTCGALTCVGGNDDGCSTASSLTFTSVAGTDYTVMVSGYNTNQGLFTLTATCGTNPPAVSSFTPASGPVGTSVTITGTGFTGATAVKFNTTAATTYTVASATSITATVPAGATSGPISVVTSGGTGTSPTAYTVTIPPANDLCTAANLPVLTCGSTLMGTTVNSTATGDPTATCTTTITPASGGVFYRFTGTGTSVTLTTCDAATTYDTKLFVFTGTCGAYTCVIGNDDVTCGAQTRTSSVTFASTAGTAYYVFVSGFNGAQGPFALTATCAPAIAAAPAPAARAASAPLEVVLYPNPATRWVDVQLTNLPAPTASAEILDSFGRTVGTLAVREGLNRLPLTGLAPGVYAVRVGGELQRLVVE